MTFNNPPPLPNKLLSKDPGLPIILLVTIEPNKPITILNPVPTIFVISTPSPNHSSSVFASGPVILPSVLLNTSSNKFGSLPSAVLVSLASSICLSVYNSFLILCPFSSASFALAAKLGKTSPADVTKFDVAAILSKNLSILSAFPPAAHKASTSFGRLPLAASAGFCLAAYAITICDTSSEFSTPPARSSSCLTNGVSVSIALSVPPSVAR